AELEGVDAVINLSGRSVDCRYTDRNRRLILDSRIESTRVLGEAIAACRQPPAVWMNASTATIYRHSFDRPMDEATGEIGATPEARDAFSIEVATAWEAALDRAATGAVRKVALRAAMVLGREGGVFPVLRRLVRLGLGGRMGTGRQYMSWIHAEDFCRAAAWILDHPGSRGPINLAAPEPVPNAAFMAAMRRHCGLPVGLPAARWMLEAGALVLRTETELILKSRRVVPGRLLAEGFRFRFPTLDSALEDLGRRDGGSGRESLDTDFTDSHGREGNWTTSGSG
ncbi:MAG: TIGR01777 family oxidoreductase, partial [Verrucomicrobiae bacterium]|nr:TIGR01777 family oxidoreductase [Verrucomicrobiae bacterium]